MLSFLILSKKMALHILQKEMSVAKKRSTTSPTDGHNESCLDMARRLGEEAGAPFEDLPEEEKLRLLRAQLVKEMPFLAALYDDATDEENPDR